MCYVFFYVLKVKVKGPDPSDKMEMENFIEKMARAAGIELQHAEGRPGDGHNTRRLTVLQRRGSGDGQDCSESRPSGMVVKLMTYESEKSHGGLMMRLGAIAFGLGTLIYSGLEFVHFFETSYDCSSWSAVTAVNPILQMIFTFMQMYYLFTHSKLNINKNKIIAKFGLMHLVATNCCIWIRTLVKESMKEITESSEFIKLVAGLETTEKLTGLTS